MPNLGPFKHGVSWSDVPTSVISPVIAVAGINVVFGSAPLWMSPNGKQCINKPRVYNRYEDAVAELGYSNDWNTYDICEHLDAVFVEFGVFPVIYVAVNDPEKNATVHAPSQFTLANGQVNTNLQLIAWTMTVTSITAAAAAAGTPPSASPAKKGAKGNAGSSADSPEVTPQLTNYVEGVDYLVSYDANNKAIITRLATGAIPSDTSQILVGGKIPAATPIGAADIIGGINPDGTRTGLEVIEDVFQKTGYVPGVVICPKWSHDPTVAAAMEAKCENINGCFACTCLIDVDTSTVKVAQNVNAWKNTNNIVFPRQQCLFGKPALLGTAVGQPGSAVAVDKVFHFASQQGPLMQWTDAYRGDGLPFCSPSNKNLRCNALQTEDGTEIPMHLLDANMLNGQGVVTALNWIGGWRSWGNRTAAYPSTSDVKDVFISVRRMFDFIGNSVVLTIWQKVDEPGNRRLIDAIVNSLQLWLDGLTNSQALVGARLEFRQDENPTTEILNGHYTFHIYIASPTPAEWLDFRIEYWVPYIQNLWADQAAA
jgi:phage tail sheath protein FI